MRARSSFLTALFPVEKRMEKREFLADYFTIADTITGHAVVMARRFNADFSKLPNLSAYADRLEVSRPFRGAEAV